MTGLSRSQVVQWRTRVAEDMHMRTRTIASKDLGLRRRRGFELAGDLAPPPRLAIVGARAARRRFTDLIPAIVEAAADRGFSVISGGALGVDSAAHRAALALDVPQLAVLPAAVGAPYPPGNAALFDAIAAHTCSGVAFVLKQGQSPTRALFSSRNSYVVGLAAAVVVVQASLRSGSMNSGRLALKQRRPLAALVGSPGCGALIGAGARAIRASCPVEVAAAISAWLERPNAAGLADPWPSHLRDLGLAIDRAGPQGLSIDDLEEPLLGLVALTEAEALDLVVDVGGGRYVRSDR